MNYKKYILLLIANLIFISLIIPSVKAELPNNTFGANDLINVNVYCVSYNNSVCDNNTVSCEITAFNPDTSFLIQQGHMQGNVSGFYNYSFGTLEQEGTYSALVHCNDSREGVINFDFIVGDPDDSYDRDFWLYAFLFLIPLFLCIIANLSEDKSFNIMAGFVLCAFAIIIIRNGLPRFTNSLIELTVFLVVMGIGFYLILRNGYDIAVEGWT